MTTSIHEGDVGTVFEVTVTDGASAVDLSAATTKEIVLRSPGGTVKTKAASFVTSGADGKIRYVTVAGDIDEDGRWEIQAHVVLPSGEWRSAIGSFPVRPNL